MVTENSLALSANQLRHLFHLIPHLINRYCIISLKKYREKVVFTLVHGPLLLHIAVASCVLFLSGRILHKQSLQGFATKSGLGRLGNHDIKGLQISRNPDFKWNDGLHNCLTIKGEKGHCASKRWHIKRSSRSFRLPSAVAFSRFF